VLRAYLNYPSSRVSIHGDPDCGHIQQARKTGQRIVIIESDSIGVELERFRQSEYGFAAEAASNDMWLDVDCGDLEFEKAVVHYVQRMLGARYQPFKDARVEEHCLAPRAPFGR